MDVLRYDKEYEIEKKFMDIRKDLKDIKDILEEFRIDIMAIREKM